MNKMKIVMRTKEIRKQKRINKKIIKMLLSLEKVLEKITKKLISNLENQKKLNNPQINQIVTLIIIQGYIKEVAM